MNRWSPTTPSPSVAEAASAGTRSRTRAALQAWRNRGLLLQTRVTAGWEVLQWINRGTWPSDIAFPAVLSGHRFVIRAAYRVILPEAWKQKLTWSQGAVHKQEV